MFDNMTRKTHLKLKKAREAHKIKNDSYVYIYIYV